MTANNNPVTYSHFGSFGSTNPRSSMDKAGLQSPSFTSPVFFLLNAAQGPNWVKISDLDCFNFQFKLISPHVEFCFSRKIHLKISLYLIQHKPNKLCHWQRPLFGNKLCHCNRANRKSLSSLDFSVTAKQNVLSLSKITLLNILLAPASFYLFVILAHFY